MAYQLLRTNIALTGNVKMCCYITNRRIDDKDSRRLTLNPISSIAPIIPHEVNLEGNSTYYNDIVEFYKDYKDIFYKAQLDPKLISKEPYILFSAKDDFSTGFADDCLAGTKRVSYEKNGKQFACLSPLYINNYAELPYAICVKLCDFNTEKVIYKNNILLHGTKIDEYMLNSYFNLNAGSPHSKIMYLGLENDGVSFEGSIHGFSVENPGLINISTDLPGKLFTQDMTLTEFDDLICHEFENKKLVLPHILNLCWYFNLEDIIEPGSIFKPNYGQEFKVQINYLDKDMNEFEVADIDFNHLFIDDGEGGNILDYLHEYELPGIAGNIKEKMEPTICKWSLSKSNGYIFNTFKGFDNSKDKPYGLKVYGEFSGEGTDVMKDSTDADDKGMEYSDNYTHISSIKDIMWMNNLYKNTTSKTHLSQGDISRDDNTYGVLMRYDYAAGKILEDSNYGLYGNISLKEIYNNHEEVFNRVDVFNGQILCNGIKYDVDDTITYKGTSHKIKKVSISYIDNITDLYGSAKVGDTNKYELSYDKPARPIILELFNSSTGCLDIIFWLPFNTDIASPTRYESLLLNYAFATNNISSVVYIVDTESWKPSRYRRTINGININPLPLRCTKPEGLVLNKTLTYNPQDNSLYQHDSSNLIARRYFGWIEPSFVKYKKTQDGWISTDNNYITYKYVERYLDYCLGYVDENIGKTVQLQPHNYPSKREIGEQITVPEYKWFFDSKIIYMPNKMSISKKYTGEVTLGDIYDELLIKYPPKYRTYVLDKYKHSIDMNADKTECIITLKLK